MKKNIFIAILLAVFLVVPAFVQASELDDQIADLHAQIAAITAQLNQLLLTEQSEAQNSSFCDGLRQDLNLNDPNQDSSINATVNNDLANLSVCAF